MVVDRWSLIGWSLILSSVFSPWSSIFDLSGFWSLVFSISSFLIVRRTWDFMPSDRTSASPDFGIFTFDLWSFDYGLWFLAFRLSYVFSCLSSLVVGLWYLNFSLLVLILRLRSSAWSFSVGPSSMVVAIWFLVFGISSLVFSLWTLVSGLWCLAFGCWSFFVDISLWSLVFGRWFWSLVFDLWYFVFSLCYFLCSLVFGLLSFVFGFCCFPLFVVRWSLVFDLWSLVVGISYSDSGLRSSVVEPRSLGVVRWSLVFCLRTFVFRLHSSIFDSPSSFFGLQHSILGHGPSAFGRSFLFFDLDGLWSCRSWPLDFGPCSLIWSFVVFGLWCLVFRCCARSSFDVGLWSLFFHPWPLVLGLSYSISALRSLVMDSRSLIFGRWSLFLVFAWGLLSTFFGLWSVDFCLWSLVVG